MKEREEMAYGVSVSTEIDAVRSPAVGDDGLSERGVLLEPDDADRVAVLQKAGAELIKVRKRPGANGQDTAAGVDEHEGSAPECWEVGVESDDPVVDFWSGDGVHGGRLDGGRRHELRARDRSGLNRRS